MERERLTAPHDHVGCELRGDAPETVLKELRRKVQRDDLDDDSLLSAFDAAVSGMRRDGTAQHGLEPGLEAGAELSLTDADLERCVALMDLPLPRFPLEMPEHDLNFVPLTSRSWVMRLRDFRPGGAKALRAETLSAKLQRGPAQER